MNLEMFAGAILGHFVGDYLFQNQDMAVGKSQPGWTGHKWCTIHILLYTFAVALFTGWHPSFLLVVAVPHWIIDRWSLATYILKFKNGYTMQQVWTKAPLCAANSKPPQSSPYGELPISRSLIEGIANSSEELQHNVWKVAFAAPVYIFNDNTLHWVCLWYTVKYLLK